MSSVLSKHSCYVDLFNAFESLVESMPDEKINKLSVELVKKVNNCLLYLWVLYRKPFETDRMLSITNEISALKTECEKDADYASGRDENKKTLNKELLAFKTGEVFERTLIRASERGEINLVTALVEKGVNVNCTEEHYKMTPLILASYMGHLEVVKVLAGVEGVDLRQQSTKGKTALQYAEDKKRDNVVSFLKERLNY